MQRPGLLYVVSAPSGAGKTTLCHQIIDFFPELRQSVSFTTRAMRSGEVDGVDYHFVDVDSFKAMIAGNAFAEWAQVHGNYYGTALETLQKARNEGRDLLLDIDFQGADQLRQTTSAAVYIFIAPPGFDELERRLRGRGTDSEAVIAQRIENARLEIAAACRYDYLIVNDHLEQAFSDLKAVIRAERCRTALVLPMVEKSLQH